MNGGVGDFRLYDDSPASDVAGTLPELHTPGFSLCAEEGDGTSLPGQSQGEAFFLPREEDNNFLLPAEIEPAVGESGELFLLPTDGPASVSSHSVKGTGVSQEEEEEDIMLEGEKEMSSVRCQMQSLLAKDASGRVLGLVVREEHALQFVSSDPASRKTCEVRFSTVQCIQVNQNVAMLSCSGQSRRRILAILAYQGCVKLENASSYRHFHRLSDEAFEVLRARRKHSADIWGWMFKPVCAYGQYLTVPSTSAQLWQRFGLGEVSEQATGCEKHISTFALQCSE